MSHINRLPYKCFRIIFHYLPLQDLLRIGLVCRKWESIQWSVFCRRRSVTLLVGKDPLDLITESRFSIPFLDKVLNDDCVQAYQPQSGSEWARLSSLGLTLEMVKFLVDALPNVLYLEISLKEISSSVIENVIILLEKWSQKLQTLKIYCRFPSEVQRTTVSNRLFRLIQCINSLPALKHLTMAFDNRFILSTEQSINYQIYLPILSRLHEFNFCSVDQPDILIDSLKRFAILNPRLHQIGIASYIDVNNQYSPERFLQLHPQLIERFGQLFIMKPPIDTKLLTKFCDRYTNLTSIKIYNIQLSLTELAKCLAPLKSLIHLGFAIKFFKRPSLSKDDSKSQEKIPQLHSIQILSLNVSLKSHTDLHSKHLGWIFPQIQVLDISHDFFYCITCKCDHYRKFSKEKCRDCMRMMLKPWKLQCDKLGHIYTNSYRKTTEWDLDEL